MNSFSDLVSSPQRNLVHEAETQRQHVRARVPGRIEFKTASGTHSLALHDLSSSGLAFVSPKGGFRVGGTYGGTLQLTMESVTLAVPVEFSVCHVGADHRVGGRFEQLEAAQIATIRRVVSSFLGGELVSAGDVMHTLARNNFISPRGGAKPPEQRGVFARFRAMAQTGLVLVFGLAALGYCVQKLGDRFFGANSSAARVTGPRFQVEMPRDGIFQSLIPADGVVKKGSPIGTFNTSLSGLVSSEALQANLSPTEIEALLGQQIQGTITSPCDCRVVSTFVTDSQYVGKGQIVAALAPVEFEPYVLARFGYRDAENLEPGSQVKVQINGEPLARKGRVTQLRHDADPSLLSQDVLVVVQPEEPLPMELVARPARVSASPATWWAGRDLGEIGTAHADASGHLH